MNERNSPGDKEPIEDQFNEDFDFGESDADMHPIRTTSKRGFNKKIVGGVFVVVFTVILVMGYRIYKPSTSSNSSKPTGMMAKATKASTIPQPPSSTDTDQNFGDIAQAFSSADNTLAPQQKSNAMENSLRELQKELFALEQPNPTKLTTQQPPGAAASPSATPSPRIAAAPEVSTEIQASQLTQSLNTLNQQIDYILNQIKNLDTYSREVAENLNKLNQAMNTMDSRLSALTNTTSTLSKDVGNVKNEVGHVKQVLQADGLDINLGALAGKKQREVKGGSIAIEEPEYTVHAVIPGRAWLKSTKGQIMTVAEGDTLGNYGKILVIDAANAVVLTSSGVAFR